MSPNEVKIKGGARFGFLQNKNGVTLTVDKNKLEINAGIIGKVVFQPSDIVKIETDRTGFSLSGPGIRIQHNVPGYRKKIIFYPKGRAIDALMAIEESGFLINKAAIPYDIKEQIELLQAGGSFPVKTSVVITIVVTWNVLSLYASRDFLFNGKNSSSPAVGLPTGFIFLFCLAMLTLEPVRNIVLKPGRKVSEFKMSLYFVMALMAVIFAMNMGFVHALINLSAK